MAGLKAIKRRAGASGGIALAASLLMPAPAMGDTRAGTAIENTAAVRWDAAGASEAGSSNTDRLLVAERLDLTLATAGSPDATGTGAAWPVRLTNTGNGEEAFTLMAVAGGTAVRVAVDADGDGRFDPARDTVLDGQTPTLGPGASLLLLVLAPGADATPTLEARAVTGSGAPGQVFANAGDGGGDAVVGSTGATARLTLDATASTLALPLLVKSQTVAAPDGSSRPMSGAVITYTLEARFTGPAAAARIEDAVPAGTRLVPGSLRLDDASLTDAVDGDPGVASGTGVSVSLGDITAPTVRRVSFQVQLP